MTSFFEKVYRYRTDIVELVTGKGEDDRDGDKICRLREEI